MTLIGMSNSAATRTASDLQPAFLPVQVQKGEVKLRASTAIPCSSITLTASVESRPPERRASAFFCMISPEAACRRRKMTLHGDKKPDIVFQRLPHAAEKCKVPA